MTEPAPTSSPTRITTGGGCLLMIFSTLGGYGVLAMLALLMLRQPRWQLSFVDLAFWIVALAIPFAQRASHAKGHGADLTTLSKRGLVVHFAVAAALWALARSVYLG